MNLDNPFQTYSDNQSEIDTLLLTEPSTGIPPITKYLKISNRGCLDKRLIGLMGGTTKIDKNDKIGCFGTGLKYAISYLIRTNNNFRLFSGEKEITFESRERVIKKETFNEIHFNGKSMGITTRYGYQWKAWEVLREVFSNAKDEGKEEKIIVENDLIKGEPKKTSFFIELTEDIQQVLNKWDDYFLNATPLFENENYAIYPNPDKILKIYKNKTLVCTDNYYTSKFIYDFKHANLNELRQYMGYAPSDIGRALLSSNKQVIDLLLEDFKEGRNYDKIEFKLEYTNVDYKPEHVKKIFSGYLFLHPESEKSNSPRAIKVNQNLFYILKESGLPTEKISSSRGHYYGGSGYGYNDDSEINYTQITNNTLEQKISTILKKYNTDIYFSIVMPVDSDFEILISESDGVLFSNDLDNVSTSDLESVVLIAIFSEKEGNIFKALKRLIKFTRTNKNFNKIFFGSH